MRYLLDTHTLIWYFEDDANLPKSVKAVIEDQNNRIYISSVTLWEITIKLNINTLKINYSLEELFDNIKIRDFDLLQIEEKHLRVYLNLPLIHRDPFDRHLVSTAIAENLTLITCDENIQKYKLNWLWR
jgi:PIN domain nuclease of toxin-antitoxin system